ncbi:hypothetical protein [Mycobacterium sp. URHB0021]
MSSTASLEVPVVRAGERVEVLFGELSELAGQRNARVRCCRMLIGVT